MLLCRSASRTCCTGRPRVSERPDHWYLSGPMTGHPEFNFPAFKRAAEYLRRVYGLNILSPAEMDEADGIGANGNPMPNGYDGTYRSLLARDVALIAQAHVKGVIVLDGWDRSKGANIEVYVARALDKPVLLYPDLAPVHIALPAPVVLSSVVAS